MAYKFGFCITFGFIVCVSIAGCGSESSGGAALTTTALGSSGEGAATGGRSSAFVAVIGDDTAPRVAAELRTRGYSVTEDIDSVRSAGTVVVAEDAPNGPRDVHRQIAEQLGRNQRARVLWLFTRMSLIDDRELMDLMQNEVVELLGAKGFPESRIQFAVDTEQTTVAPETLKGWSSVEAFLSGGGR